MKPTVVTLVVICFLILGIVLGIWFIFTRPPASYVIHDGGVSYTLYDGQKKEEVERILRHYLKESSTPLREYKQSTFTTTSGDSYYLIFKAGVLEGVSRNSPRFRNMRSRFGRGIVIN